MGLYTKEHEFRVDAIVTPIAICDVDAFRDGVISSKIFRSQNAVWDTGATNTLISRKVVDVLSLKSFNKVAVSDNKGVAETDTYLVHIALPTNDMVTNLEVLLTDNEDYDVIIGMDIIGMGDFSLKSKDGNTKFSFSI